MTAAAMTIRSVVPITLLVDEAGLPVGGADFSSRVMTYGGLDRVQSGDAGIGDLAGVRLNWADGCLDASLDERLPVLTWAHDWAEPLGRATSWRRDGADVLLSWEFDDVPRATQARTQMRPGRSGRPPTITDISIGLTAMELEFTDPTGDGSFNDVLVTSGTVSECALTLRGAILGAQVLPETITFSADTWRGLARRTPLVPVPAPLAVPSEDQVVEWAGGVERMQAALTRAGRPTTPRRTRR